jgi:translation elongation factor P/translation initiation factor 5A
MINAQDIKIGTAIRMDGKLYFCIDFLHVKPGKGNTFMRTKLKDVVNGYVLSVVSTSVRSSRMYVLSVVPISISIRRVAIISS